MQITRYPKIIPKYGISGEGGNGPSEKLKKKKEFDKTIYKFKTLFFL